MNFTDSSNYYSTVKDQQPCAKQTNNSDAAYKVSKCLAYWLLLHTFGQ